MPPRNLMMRACTAVLFVFVLSSCATAPKVPPVCPAPSSYAPVTGVFARQDVYHVVGPGETLWRISKMYDVRINDVMCANNIPKANQLEMGQRLFIPGAAPMRPVIPLYPSKKWKYIIVHHSATDEGDALALFDLHKRRGWEGLGYHFVIDNGTSGKNNGQIEVSPRWLHQRNGAHCKASGMNEKGIGVCLVGNYSKDRVDEKQIESLLYLINILRKYYKIPVENIYGHGQVPGARTECPGLNFPWNDFKRRLRELK